MKEKFKESNVTLSKYLDEEIVKNSEVAPLVLDKLKVNELFTGDELMSDFTQHDIEILYRLLTDLDLFRPMMTGPLVRRLIDEDAFRELKLFMFDLTVDQLSLLFDQEPNCYLSTFIKKIVNNEDVYYLFSRYRGVVGNMTPDEIEGIFDALQIFSYAPSPLDKYDLQGLRFFTRYRTKEDLLHFADRYDDQIMFSKFLDREIVKCPLLTRKLMDSEQFSVLEGCPWHEPFRSLYRQLYIEMQTLLEKVTPSKEEQWKILNMSPKDVKKAKNKAERLLRKTTVSVDWLNAHLEDPDLKVLDASWYMPDEQRTPLQEYKVEHIPSALFFNLDDISDQTSELPHMLPSEEAFGPMVSALGIENKDLLIVYDGKGIFSAARVWWMFQVFGHDKIRVLDGGFPRWCELACDVERGAPGIEQEYQAQSVTFETNFQPHLLWTLDQVKENIENSTHQLIDARSKTRFDGSAPEPRQGLRSGHVPGSKCVPFPKMLDCSQSLLPADELKKIFEVGGILLDKGIVTSSGTSVTACVLALGLHRLWWSGSVPYGGLGCVPVYDGSWTEWGGDHNTPVATSEE